MWYAVAEFDGPTVSSVSLVRDPQGVVLVESPSLKRASELLPDWAAPLLDDQSLELLDESSNESLVTWTIQTETWATIAIHLRDVDKNDCLARGSGGEDGIFRAKYVYDYEHPPIVVVSVLAGGHKPYRAEMTLPSSEFYFRPYLSRESR